MKNGSRSAVLLPAVILCLMLLSVFPRLSFHFPIASLGEGFLDSETGLPYFEDMDCYYHLRMTEDILLYGHPGDTVKDGAAWDSFSYAPEGRSASGYKPMLSYCTIAANRLISVFTPQSLGQTAYWLSPFLSSLVVIPVFLLTFEMCGLTGAVTASVLSALNLGYLYNTVPGFYDTDCVVIWISCFFFYFGVRLVKGFQEKNRKSLIINGSFFVLSFIALYQSWYIFYMFPVILAGAFVLFTILTWKKEREKTLYFFAPFLLAAGIGIAVLLLERNLFTSVIGIVKHIFSETESGGIFSNVFASIGELQNLPLWAGSLSDLFRLKVFSATDLCIINLAGGILPFISAFAMSMLLIRRIILKDVRVEYLILLLWYGITLVLSFKGQRFIILLAMPAAILSGNLAGTLCGLMDRRRPGFRAVYRAAVLSLLLLPVLLGVYDLYSYLLSSSAEIVLPDRSVEECLLKLRDQTPEDTVLISWWDYGYFLEEKAKRRALFDGGTQYDQRTYLISRAFATKNEELSANIFRMLSGSGNAGLKRMLSTFGETDETLLFLDELLSGSPMRAREMLLQKGISDASADELAALLFPKDLPPMECVITPDMPWICGWLPVYGRTGTEQDESRVRFAWDAHRMPISLSESGETAIDTGSGYYVLLKQEGEGFSARTSLTEAFSGEQPIRVERVILADSDGYREYMQEQDSFEKAPAPDEERAALPWTVILYDDGQETYFSMVSSDLADSVFGRLVYLGGAGLSHYAAETGFPADIPVFRIDG